MTPIGFFENIDDIKNINFSLKKNNEIVQLGNSKDMIFNINKLIEEISKYVTLKIGDLIFTGTPKGVSRVVTGDLLEGYIEDKQLFKINIYII